MPTLEEFRAKFEALGLPKTEQDSRIDRILNKANDKVPVKIEEFNRRMTKATKSLPAETVTLVQKKIVLDLLRRVVEKTPVDTGRARGNWQVSIGKLTDRILEGTKKSGGKRSFRRDIVESGNEKMENLPNFSTVFVQNNVPYILYLEDGTASPKQAPNGMLSVSLQELSETFGD